MTSLSRSKRGLDDLQGGDARAGAETRPPGQGLHRHLKWGRGILKQTPWRRRRRRTDVTSRDGGDDGVGSNDDDDDDDNDKDDNDNDKEKDNSGKTRKLCNQF